MEAPMHSTGAQKILVVDDEKNLVEMLAKYLTERGYSVVRAHDGEEGLKKVREEKPDLIIMDIHMPGIDGYHAIQELQRSEGPEARIPVIVLSVRGKMKDVFGPEDIVDFVDKPFKLEELLAKIKSVLSLQKGPRKERRVLIVGAPWAGVRILKEFLEWQKFSVLEIQDTYKGFEQAMAHGADLVIASTALRDVNIVEFSQWFRRLPSTRKVLYIVYDPIKMYGIAPHKSEELRADLFIDCETGEDLRRGVKQFVDERFN